MDPGTALTFTWSFDIEPYSATGSDAPQIDMAAIRKALSMMRGDGADRFREYLIGFAAGVESRAREADMYARRRFEIAAEVRSIAEAKGVVR
jgi:hypothetical protein